MQAWICAVTTDKPDFKRPDSGTHAVEADAAGKRPLAANGAARQWTARAVGRYKPFLFLICLFPVGRWIFLATGPEGLGVNPPEYLIRSTGIWAVVLLWLTLCVTPLRRLLHQPALVRVRRMLGLFSFFYTVLHVLGWAYWERGGSLEQMWIDILQRTFVWVGVLATVPMVLLAMTSTRGWMRRLGAGWQRLHASIYGIAALSVLHFWLVRSGKVDYREPAVYAGILVVILICRYAVARSRS